jgi:hypothetical protein
MQSLGHSLGSALRTAGTANRNASKAKVVSNLRKSQSELRAAAVKLEKITPPDKIKAQHALLLKGVLLYADELDTVIAHVRGSGGVGALREITGLAGVAEMGKASAAIQKAGYVIVDR